MLTRRRLGLAVVAVFIPVLWLAGTAAGGKAPAGGGAGLYPDLQTAVPHHFTVQNNQQREFLRFSNLIANTGAGDLRIRPEHDAASGRTIGIQEILDAQRNVVSSQAVSEFEFHPAHNHWHITDVALFELRTALDNGTDGRYGAVFSNQSIKTTFCLIDWVKLEGNSSTTERNYWDCFPDAVQGISAGWGDQYHHQLEGQELEITGAKPGVYYLVSVANPDGSFLETTTANNTAWSSFRVSRDSKGNAKVAAIAHSPCSTASLCGEALPNR
jgi:hypothetical protein